MKNPHYAQNACRGLFTSVIWQPICLRSGCSTVIRSSNENLDRLNQSVEAGNQWAAQYSAEHIKDLDGGNLEDALIALGQFSNRNMTRFLLFAKGGILSERELSDALTMLPLSLSDNPDAQLKVLNQRRSKVVSVTRKDLLQQQDRRSRQ